MNAPWMNRLRTALPFLLPILGLGTAFVLTRGETAFPPRVALLAMAAIVFAVLAGLGGQRPRLALDLPLAALMGVAAGHLFLAPGLPYGHDTSPHMWAGWAACRAVETGAFFPRWIHQIGMGIPLLQFYGPVGYFALLPFCALGLDTQRVLAAGFLSYGVIAALAMYLAVARWTGDRRAGLVAAAAYAFAPYRLLDANYRMALGESVGLALLPLALFGTMEAVRSGGRRRIALGALSAALLIAAHPLTAFMAVLGLALWMGAEALPGSSGGWRSLRARLPRAAAVWVLGAALAGFYVLPFLTEVKATRLGLIATGEVRTRFSLHALTPEQLLRREAWERLKVSHPAYSPKNSDEMPFYFGLVLLALLPLAATGKAPPRGLLVMTAGSLLLTLHPIAGWAEVVFPPLHSLYFPWRFLSIASCGAAAAAGFAVLRVLAVVPQRWSRAVPGVLGLLLLADAAPYTGAAQWVPPYEGFGFLRVQRACEQGRDCLKHVPLARPWPLRVSGNFMPPSDRRPDVGLLWFPFPEYTTRAVFDAYFDGLKPRRLARAGVGVILAPRPERPPARPYATWKSPRRHKAVQPRRFERGGGRILVFLDGRPGRVVVLEQYFPGWQVLTSEGWREVQPTRDGLLRADVAAGQREVRFRFTESRWDRAAGWALSALTGLVLIGMCVRARPREGLPPGRG